MMRSTAAEINTDNLRHNVGELNNISNSSKIMAIIKANAYGHGIIPIAKILQEEGVDFFAVAFPDEAAMLRKAGIKEDILILVPGNSSEYELVCEYNLQVIASSRKYMRKISAEAVKRGVTIKAHLNVDTGMNRDGIAPENVMEFAKEFAQLENIELAGLFTHFATSPTDIEFAKKQLALFNEFTDKLSAEGYDFEYIHAANSGAIINLPEARFTHVRPGISLYGCLPEQYLHDKINLKPVLSLKTKVNIVRRIKPGDSVGYDRLFIADRETTIVNLPIGYGDGFPKRLTSIGECIIRGRKYPIVGSVCMDQCMVNVGDDIIEQGDEAILIGSQGAHTIKAADIAAKLGTIPYEVLCGITERVPRIYI